MLGATNTPKDELNHKRFYCVVGSVETKTLNCCCFSFLFRFSGTNLHFPQLCSKQSERPSLFLPRDKLQQQRQQISKISTRHRTWFTLTHVTWHPAPVTCRTAFICNSALPAGWSCVLAILQCIFTRVARSLIVSLRDVLNLPVIHSQWCGAFTALTQLLKCAAALCLPHRLSSVVTSYLKVSSCWTAGSRDRLRAPSDVLFQIVAPCVFLT